MIVVKLELLTPGKIQYWDSISEAALDLDSYPNNIRYAIEKTKDHRKGLWKLSYVEETSGNRKGIRGQYYEVTGIMLCASLKEASNVSSIPYWQLTNMSKTNSKHERLVMAPNERLYRVMIQK